MENTKQEANNYLIDTINTYNLTVNDISNFKFNKREVELFTDMMIRFKNDQTTQLRELVDTLRIQKWEKIDEAKQLREENKRLRKAAQKLLDWNTKYPPGKIYSYGSAKVMESELQEVVSESEQILYDIENKKPNNY
jgi:hypothetical protein